MHQEIPNLLYFADINTITSDILSWTTLTHDSEQKVYFGQKHWDIKYRNFVF